MFNGCLNVLEKTEMVLKLSMLVPLCNKLHFRLYFMKKSCLVCSIVMYGEAIVALYCIVKSLLHCIV